MVSDEYRQIISRMTYNLLKKHFPGLKKLELQKACKELSINIHARMYGANVDGVDSPIWRDRQCGDKSLGVPPNLPKVDAKELLKYDDDSG